MAGRGGHQGVTEHRGVLLQQFRAGRPVGEHGHRVRGGDEQVRDVRRGAEDLHEPLSDDVLVAQQPQEPGLGHGRVREFAVGQQPGVRVDGAGQPVHQRRQDHRLDAVLAGTARGQCGEVVHRPVGVPVAERGDLALRRLRAHPQRLHRDRDDRVQQRPVEQFGVQLADLVADLPGLDREFLGDRVVGLGADPRRAPQPGPRGEIVLGRQGVGAPQVPQLHPVFQQPHEAVAGDEGVPVGAADVAAVDQGVERVHGRPDPEALVHPAVHQLEQLDGELHVPQSPGPQLQLAGLQVLRHVLDDTAAHGLHVRDEVLPLRRRPHHRRHAGDVVPPQIEVAGHRAGLEQGLELPGRGPPPVVGQVRVEGADQGAVAALRTQRRVDLEEVPAADVDELAGQPGRRGVGGFGDEDDVHIGDVVEFPGAALAHRQHRQLRLHRPVREDGGDRHCEGGGQGRIGGVRQSCGDGDEVGGFRLRGARHIVGRRPGHEGPGEVDGGDAGQQGAVGVAHRTVGGGAGDRGPVQQRILRVRPRRPLRADRGEHRRHQLVAPRHRPTQFRPDLRRGDDMVAQQRGRPEQGEQPHPEHHVIAQGRQQRVDTCRRVDRPRRLPGPQILHEADDRDQCPVRVTGRRQGPQQIEMLLIVPAQRRQIGGRVRPGQPQRRRGGHTAPGGPRLDHQNSRLWASSQGVTWAWYSFHSRHLLRRKNSKTCSPSASATSSDFSIACSARSRSVGRSL